MKVLTKPQLKKALTSLDSDWKLAYKDTRLTRKFATSNFVEGLMLLTKVTVHAQVQDHHPEAHLTYHQLKLTLTTHEAGGITNKDIALAKKIDQL